MKTKAELLLKSLRNCSDDYDALEVVEQKLKEIINSTVYDCMNSVLSEQEKWGETAVCVKFITKDITQKILDNVV